MLLLGRERTALPLRLVSLGTTNSSEIIAGSNTACSGDFRRAITADFCLLPPLIFVLPPGEDDDCGYESGRRIDIISF